MTFEPLRPGFRITDGDGRVSPEFLRKWEEVRNSVAGFPVGTLAGTMVATEPAGWLLCNGQTLKKDRYAALYAVVGDTFGSTATTFDLPNLQDRALVGQGAISLKGTGGNNSITLTVAQLPAHSHSVTDAGHSHGVTDAGHTHSTGVKNATADAQAGSDVHSAIDGTTGSATTGVSVSSATTGISVDSTGSGDAVDITPKAMGINWIIKS